MYAYYRHCIHKEYKNLDLSQEKCLLSTSAATRTLDHDDLSTTTTKRLVEFRHCRLHYPPSHQESLTQPLNLTISCPTLGGHALLGRNSSGKSLVGQTIVARGQPSHIQDGTFWIPSNWMSNAIAHVSFDSHQELLQEGGTTYRAISGGNGTLNKAAQLYALLPCDVDTLSTVKYSRHC